MSKKVRARFVVRPLTLPVDRPTLPAPSLDDPNQQIDEAWFEVMLGEAWTAAYRITAQDGAPVIAELRVYPREPETPEQRPGHWSGAILGTTAAVPPGGLTGRLLRQLRPGHVRGSDLQEGLEAWRRYVGLVPDMGRLVQLHRAGFQHLHRRRRMKPPRWDEATLVRAAAFYVERGGHHPVHDLAKAYRIKPTQARDLLQAARRKGFLTAGRLGKASRGLTDKAKARLTALSQEATSS